MQSKLYRYLIKICLLALVSDHALGQMTIVNLDEAYRLAKGNDHQWLGALAKHKGEVEVLPQALGALRPQVNLTVSRSLNNQTQDTAGRTPTAQRYQSGSQILSVLHPIIRQQQTHEINRASAQVAYADWYLSHEEGLMAIRLTQAYTDVLLAHDRIRAIRDRVTVAGERLAYARAAFNAGRGPKHEVDSALAELSVLKAEALKSDYELISARRRLGVLIGASQPIVGSSLANVKELDALNLPSLEDAVAQALGGNPEILAAREKVRVSSAALKYAQAASLPTLDLVAQLSHSNGENSFFASTSQRSRTIGLQFNMPLYAGGRNASFSRQAAAELELANETLNRLIDDVTLAVQTEHENLVQSLALSDALKLAVDAAEELVSSMRLGQINGLSSRLDVTVAAGKRQDAAFEFYRIRYDRLNAWLRLRLLMGTPVEDTVSELSNSFAFKNQ